MALYELEYDEGIVLQSTTAMLGGASEEEFENEELMELVVTNKRIIYVVEISTGVFSKAKTEVRQVPISSIKVINGVPQVKQVKHDMWGHSVQVQFVHGVEYWTLEKKMIPEWVSEISHLLVGESPSITPNTDKIPNNSVKDEILGATAVFGSALKGMVDTAKEMASEAKQQFTKVLEVNEKQSHDETTIEEVVEQKSIEAPVTNEQINEEEKKYIFCCNCGEKLVIGSKFCNTCGTPTNNYVSTKEINKEEPVTKNTEIVIDEKQTVETQIHNEESISERKTVYEGEIYKCPNCGDILDAYESVCESCGWERRGSKATRSVQELSQKLQEIEINRPANKKTVFRDLEAEGEIISKTDQQKIDLIKNFPIPNNKEDMYEFLVLAISNVDANTYGLSGGSNTHKAISNAWLSKLEQAYTKARVVFGKQPDFSEISVIYQEKQQEIAAVKKKKGRAIIAIVFGSIAGGLAILALILAFAIPGIKKDKEKVAEETARLNTIVQEVYDAIEDEDYVLARAKAATLVFMLPSHGYESEDWEQVRIELLEIVDKAEQGLDYDPVLPETSE